MMRKSMLALCLGLMVAATGVSGTSLVSQAAEVTVEATELSVADEAQAEAAEGELQTKLLQSKPIQEGYFNSARIAAVDEAAVLNGVTSWSAAFTQRITEGIRNFQTKVDVSDLGIAVSDANDQILIELYQAVLDSNPDFFYATGGFGYSYYVGGNVISIKLNYDDYTDANGNIDMTKINAYNVAKTRAMAVVKDGMTDVEKLLALHDYLALNCTYDYDNYLNGTLPDTVYSSYGALVNKSAVCSGYAMAYSELVRTAGIPCYIVASDAMDHAWNLVYVDGAWYHVDVTFDDPVVDYTVDYSYEGAVDHSSFLKSDAEMLELEYEDWFHEYTYNQLPAATVSGSYADAIFRNKGADNGEPLYITSFNYHDGYWYYLTYTDNVEPYGNGYISRSKLNGDQLSIWSEEGAYDFMQMMDGRFFYADTNGMYTATLAPDLQPERIMTMIGSKTYRECLVDEFAVYGDGTISAEVYNVMNDTYHKVAATVNTRETIAMPKLVITKTPTINYSENTDEVLLDGAYGLRYSDGSLLSVNTEGIIAYCDALTTEGVYDVELDWRGLTTTYQVSLKYDFPIADVLASEDNWKYNGIKYVYDNHYMNGVDANHFAPDQTLTRAMLVQILYNMEETPAIDFVQQFPDVTSDKWYAKAVTWAYENNIASGYDTGKFGAEDNITREQAAVMLKKYAELKGIDTTGRADLNSYGDVDMVHDWAEDAISWANYSKIINGKLGNILDPRGNATRAEMAAMITNFCNNLYE